MRIIDIIRLTPPPDNQPKAETIGEDVGGLLAKKSEAFNKRMAGRTLEELRAGHPSYDDVEFSVQGRNMLMQQKLFEIGDTSHIQIEEKPEMVSTPLFEMPFTRQEMDDAGDRLLAAQDKWYADWMKKYPETKEFYMNGDYGRHYLQNLEKLMEDDPAVAFILRDMNFDFDTYKWDKNK